MDLLCILCCFDWFNKVKYNRIESNLLIWYFTGFLSVTVQQVLSSWNTLMTFTASSVWGTLKYIQLSKRVSPPPKCQRTSSYSHSLTRCVVQVQLDLFPPNDDRGHILFKHWRGIFLREAHKRMMFVRLVGHPLGGGGQIHWWVAHRSFSYLWKITFGINHHQWSFPAASVSHYDNLKFICTPVGTVASPGTFVCHSAPKAVRGSPGRKHELLPPDLPEIHGKVGGTGVRKGWDDSQARERNKPASCFSR